MKVPITEETTVQIVHTLFAKLATIRRLNPDDLLVPEQKTTYEKTLEQTYDALVFLEKAIDHLVNELSCGLMCYGPCQIAVLPFVEDHLHTLPFPLDLYK